MRLTFSVIRIHDIIVLILCYDVDRTVVYIYIIVYYGIIESNSEKSDFDLLFHFLFIYLYHDMKMCEEDISIYNL